MSDTPLILRPHPVTERYDTHIPNPLVMENRFLSITPDRVEPPTFLQAREILPDPIWLGHPANIDCYWKAWELAFGNLRQPTVENDFTSNYCDTAFNGNLFMWDSAFITCFGGYGRRAFDFQKTLDNFYRKQHSDGFICREISETDGQDTFHRFDPSSTGPNILAWAEWNNYLQSGDRHRLEMVFSPLVAYHQWLRTFHTWPDGSYWSTGWGSGMDNLPRVRSSKFIEWGHDHMTWVDATLQAILSGNCLLQMAGVLGKEDSLPDVLEECDRLANYVNRMLWDAKNNFYYDRFANGDLSSIKHIGAYWALLAECVPADRIPNLVFHLENPAEFNRVHRVPALSADDPNYSETGGYWCGGVWAPTNYMVLKGLGKNGWQDLAHRIAINHNDRVVRVFESDDTPWKGADQFREYFHISDLKVDDHHTLWENYAPDSVAPGGHSKPGYVGWSGLPPISVLFEDIFGLVPDAPSNRLTWRIKLPEEHGVNRYPFGRVGTVDLKCHSRITKFDRPNLEIRSNIPLTLEIIWDGGRETFHIEQELGKSHSPQ